MPCVRSLRSWGWRERTLLDDFAAPTRSRRWTVFAVLSVLLVIGLIALPLVTDIVQGPFISTVGNPAPLTGSKHKKLITIEHQTVRLRHLKPVHPVRVVFLGRRPFAQKLKKLFSTGLSSQAVTGDYQEWVLSGLVPRDTNVSKILTSGVASQVAGWYSFKTKRLYILDVGSAFGIDRWYLAHEYTHALQDQHFHLAKLERDPVDHRIHNSDRALAVRSLVEGDAVTTQYAYMDRYYTSAERAALIRQSQSQKEQPLPRAIEEQF